MCARSGEAAGCRISKEAVHDKTGNGRCVGYAIMRRGIVVLLPERGDGRGGRWIQRRRRANNRARNGRRRTADEADEFVTRKEAREGGSECDDV